MLTTRGAQGALWPEDHGEVSVPQVRIHRRPLTHATGHSIPMSQGPHLGLCLTMLTDDMALKELDVCLFL